MIVISAGTIAVRSAVCVVLTLLWGSAAYAQSPASAAGQVPITAMTSAKLFGFCTTAGDKNNIACYAWMDGYMSGIINAQYLAKFKNAPSITCIPAESTTLLQDVNMFVDYARHTSDLSRWAGLYMLAVLETAYPCPPPPQQ